MTWKRVHYDIRRFTFFCGFLFILFIATTVLSLHFFRYWQDILVLYRNDFLNIWKMKCIFVFFLDKMMFCEEKSYQIIFFLLQLCQSRGVSIMVSEMMGIGVREWGWWWGWIQMVYGLVLGKNNNNSNNPCCE